MVDPQDVEAVAAAMHTVLEKKGFNSFVPEEEVQAMAAFMVESLDYARAQRKKTETPQPPDLKPHAK